MSALASAIYEGRVAHRRHLPTTHGFDYRMAQLYLDLDELSAVFDGHRLWSVNRRNVAEFRRSDYLGPPDIDLAQAVRARVHEQTGVHARGPIRLLTHPRYLGYVFNPVSFYYCYDESGTDLEHVVAEITNTPWGERHAYVLDAAGAREGDELVWRFPKRFHVSPFFGMAQEYEWRFGVPGESLSISMTNREGGERVFSAGLACRRRPLPTRGPAGPLLRAAPLSLRVYAAIYWQALRLWWKRAPFHVHPKKRASLCAISGVMPSMTCAIWRRKV